MELISIEHQSHSLSFSWVRGQWTWLCVFAHSLYRLQATPISQNLSSDISVPEDHINLHYLSSWIAGKWRAAEYIQVNGCISPEPSLLCCKCYDYNHALSLGNDTSTNPAKETRTSIVFVAMTLIPSFALWSTVQRVFLNPDATSARPLQTACFLLAFRNDCLLQLR